MSPEETQVLVVGAGPSGLIAAREASQRRIDVLVLEEHAEIGRPCHCAGLLSLRGMRRLNVPADGSFAQNKIRGAIFFSPSGLSFTIERRDSIACVVNRVTFDKFLASQAVKSGAKIKLGYQVHNVRLGENEVLVESGKKVFKADIVIDAEGAASRIVKTAGLEPLNPASLLPGIQLDLTGVKIDPNYVEVYFGQKIAPGFFAWVIPLGEDSVRVGLGCKEANPHESIKKFIEKRFGGERYEILTVRSGLIVASGPIKRTFSNRLLVVGDAAGQVKPTTGGGVIFGGICASIAGRVAAEAIKRGRFEEGFLSLYEKLWKEKLSKEFKYMIWAKRVYNALSDKAIDRIFELIIKKNLQQVISEKGDMDFQSDVLLELRRRRIFKLLIPFLRFMKHSLLD